MSKKIYRVRSYFSGLGDELQFSTLPELAAQSGNKVYLLNDPERKQVNKPRNDEIIDFVWGTNPFVIKDDAIKSIGEWNLGDTMPYENRTGNFIKNWESLNGFTPTNSLPKIYQAPKIERGVEGLIELSSISLQYDQNKVENIVKQICNSFPTFKFYDIESKYQSNKLKVYGVLSVPVLSLSSLFDLICSCKVFISLNSGSNSLAAAARRYNKNLLHYCINPVFKHGEFMHNRKFIYPGSTYLEESATYSVESELNSIR